MLGKRLTEHRLGIKSKFAHRYNIHRLVHYKTTNDVHVAIRQERQIKDWKRNKKVAMIEEENPERRDPSENWDDVLPLESLKCGDALNPWGPLGWCNLDESPTGEEGGAKVGEASLKSA